MKLSKKIFIPILAVIVIVGVFAGISIKNSKYPLPDVKSSEINAMTISHDGHLTMRTVSNSDGKKALKLIKNILKDGVIDEEQGSFIYDDFMISMSKAHSDNYYIEVPFGRMKDISLKEETITCDVIVICPQEKAIFYHSPDTYTVKKVTLKGSNFDKLSNFLSSYN